MSESENHWHALRLTVLPEAVEAIEFAFNSLNALGTETELIRRTSSEVAVTAYFDRLPSDEVIQDELHYALQTYGLDENAIISIERKEIESEDWLAKWKKHWTPTKIGNFVIAAPWHDVEEAERIVIRIEPNMAFGTGTHETTQLCLGAIDELYTPGDSFLDVGTGTGILAIAAALKTNPESDAENGNHTGGNPSDSEGVVIHGFDSDVNSTEIAKDNAELNKVGKFIKFFASPISESTPAADLVCANLTLDVILPILELLLAKGNRYLVLSGILSEQESQIVNALSAHDALHDIRRSGEWICVVIKK
jgi:ribosomal protein L11 methyltransferase